jgi:hypothetical protein
MSNVRRRVVSHACLEEHANAFRCAIERLRPIKLPGGLGDFPNGNCLSASLLLGAYLVDKGIAGFQSVWGERYYVEGRADRHVWLADGPLIVDITADQFEEGQPRVIVTDRSTWHQTFDITAFDASDFRDAAHSRLPVYELNLLYENLKTELSSPRQGRDA